MKDFIYALIGVFCSYFILHFLLGINGILAKIIMLSVLIVSMLIKPSKIFKFLK